MARNLTVLSLIALSLSDLALGQERIEELPVITVTSTRSERDLMNIPISVGVVNDFEYDREPVMSVADMLSDIPGAFVAGGNQPGNRKVSLRGLGPEHTLIFVDGVKQSGFMDTYGATISIDPSNIERIELIKGPASVLYGSDALGGVLNIITKKGAGSDKAIGFSTRLIYDSATKGYQPQAAVYGSVKGFGYRFSAVGQKAKDRDTPRGKLLYSDYQHQDYSGQLSYAFERGRLEIGFEDFRRQGGLTPLDFTQDNAPIMDPALVASYSRTIKDDRKTLRGKLVLEDLCASLERLTLSGYGQKAILEVDPKNGQSQSLGKNGAEYQGLGFSLQSEWGLGPHQITLGFDYDKVKFEDNRRRDDLPTLPLLNYQAKGYNLQMATFIQDEWQITQNFKITGGLRQNWTENVLDRHSQAPAREKAVKENRLVASLGVNWEFLEDFSARVLFSQGFKTPTPLQLLTGSGYLLPNPDLTPETSDNYEVGLRYFSRGLYLDLSLYYNSIKDAIDYVSTPYGNQYQNVDDKKNYGLELAASYLIEPLLLTPYASINLMKVKTVRDGFKTDHNDRAEFTGKLGLKWEKDLGEKTRLYLDANAEMASRSFKETFNSATNTVSRSAIRPAWQTANLALSLESQTAWGKCLASLNLKNLFDQDYIPVGAFLPEPGFQMIASVGWEF
jgi:hemoglobin/transferrin/lactoferrin receptor protein